MSGLILKLDELVLYRRAVPWTRALDDTAVKRGSVHVVEYDLARLGRGPDGIARRLLFGHASAVHLVFKGERRHIVLAFLYLHLREVDAVGIDPDRGSRLES